MSRRPHRSHTKPSRRSTSHAALEQLERRSLLTTFIVDTPLDSLNVNQPDGVVTLREAVLASILNEPIGDAPAGTPGLDTITFNLPDSVIPIRLVAPLPTITDNIDFDGTTQPGYSGSPIVELDGSLAGAATEGLVFDVSDNSVVGLVINRFGGSGLVFRSYDNLIAGNYIGTDRTGTQAEGNGLNGVELLFGRNTVGGVSAAEANLISANGQAGIRISGLDASGNRILGNRIGTNATIDGPLPNGTHGVFIDGASLNVIGSAAPNYIWWNAGDGVQIVDVGVSQPSDRNAILGNSITGNGGLGIDLDGDGPTLNAPVLQSITLEPGGMRVQGVYDAPSSFDSSSIFRLEFFSDAGDPSNFGQGRDLLGAIDVDAGVMGGPTNFSALLPTPPLGTLAILSATATGLPSGTTEFSANLAIPTNLAVAMAPAYHVGSTGSVVALDIAMRSDGPAPATGSVLTVNLPAGMQVVSATPSRGTVSVAGQVLTLDLGTLNAKETATLALQVRPTLPGDQIVQAVFSSTAPDPDPSDNTASSTFDVFSPADLAQTKMASSPEVLRGDELTFTLTTRNVGTVAAPIARVGDTLPAGFRLISAETSRGTVFVSGQTVVGEFGLLEVGGLATLTIRVVAEQAGIFQNTATASSALPEGNPADNTATASVTVDDFDLVVRNTNDDGRNSLRRAIVSAQRLPGVDTVLFAIPGAGPHVIAPLSPLPTLTETLVINGASQPAGEILLDGSAAGTTSGLVLATSDAEINGLTIYGFNGSGITVVGDRNILRSNIIGVDAGPRNALDGIEIRDGAGNRIESNQLLSNARHGLLITGPGATLNVVSGNLARGNGEAGVLVAGGAALNRIDRNQLSGNGTVGLGLYGTFASDGTPIYPGAGGFNEVIGNTIGDEGLANGTAGLLILESPGNVVTGGPGAIGGLNTIRGGEGIGVWIVGRGSAGNSIGGRTTVVGGNSAPFTLGSAIRIEYGAARNSIGGSSEIISHGLDGIELANGAADNTIGPIQVIGTPLSFMSNRRGIVVGPGTSGTVISGTSVGGPLSAGLVLAGGQTRVTGFRDTYIPDPHRSLGTAIQVESPGNTIDSSVFSWAATALKLVGAGASGNLVQGNLFSKNPGMAASSTAIIINGAPANTIGGFEPGAGNRFLSFGTSDPATHAALALNGSGATRNWIAGNQIGLDGSTGATGFSGDGIILNGAVGNTIGGSEPGAANVISANKGAGIRLLGPDSSGNVIQGNRIGTDAAGASALPNRDGGIVVANAPDNLIGGTEPGAGNVVSGNAGGGIRLLGQGASGNRILGNRIGTDAVGNSPLPNQEAGVIVQDAPGNVIGSGNIISGNAGVGIELVGQGAAANLIQGNRIGTDAAGERILPNATDGIYLFDAPSNLFVGNLISGNGSVGIQLHGSLAQSNRILGNFIGTNAAGTAALPNRRTGVYINDAPRNAIGAAGDGNLISGNGQVGVQLSGFGAAFNVVAGNLIGTNASGASRLPNGNSGVLIENAPANTIGGAGPGAGNTISGHTSAGVYIYGSLSAINVVQGNRVGTDAAGTGAIANGNGVLIDGALSNLVGGDTPGAGNLISGNEVGLRISGAGASNNRAQGNLIGLAADGSNRLGNTLGGLFISDAPSNLIGGSLPNLGNTISANGGTGLQIFGPGASGNLVQGNRIGTDLSGTVARGNLEGGVFINNAQRNTIGGTAAGQGNLIAGNREFAVLVAGRQAQGNVVAGNQTELATPRPSRVRFVRRPGR
jgi:uncharacterized repeat protein (TIGR01451 family)